MSATGSPVASNGDTGDGVLPEAAMSRQTRRRLRTRAALLNAGRTLLVEGRVHRGVLRLLGIADDEAARTVGAPVSAPPAMEAWALA